MEEWIQLIVIIILGVGALFTRVLSRRGSKEEPDVVLEEGEVTLPPWGNLPMEEEAPAARPVPPPAPQVTSKPDLAKEETQVQSPVDPMIPTILGIPISPQTFRQGIILAEILRPPKSLREPRQ